MVLLLTAWVKSELHPVCTQPQLNALARNIRVEHLSPLYLHCILPELAWFRSCSVAPDGGRGNSVMAAPSALRMLALQHALGGQAAVAVSWKGPPAWVSGRRSGTSLPTTVQIDWQLGPQDLEALQAAKPGREPLRSPTSSYLNGVFYTLEVETGVAAASAAGLVRGGVTLGICLCPDKGIMAAVFGDTAEDQCPFLYSTDLWAGNKTFVIRPRISSSRIGWPNIVRGATVVEAVAPLLVGGYLNLKALIKGVAEPQSVAQGLFSYPFGMQPPGAPQAWPGPRGGRY